MKFVRRTTKKHVERKVTRTTVLNVVQLRTNASIKSSFLLSYSPYGGPPMHWGWYKPDTQIQKAKPRVQEKKPIKEVKNTIVKLWRNVQCRNRINHVSKSCPQRTMICHPLVASWCGRAKEKARNECTNGSQKVRNKNLTYRDGL
jgi:hypothetical protein